MREDNTPTVEARKRKPRTTRARIRAETAKKLRVLVERKRKRREGKKDDATDDAKDGEKPDKTKSKPKPKIRRNLLNDPPEPPAKFRKRQLNKTWLPTHGWHAKRARMTEPKHPLWRFAMPLTPNEKIYRPTHRAQGDRGAVVWDMSYMSTIGLYGNPVGITRVLQRIGLTSDTHWNMKGAKWRKGTRSCCCDLSRETKTGRRLMCPATVIWNPIAPDQEHSEDPKKQKREVFFRLHPSAFLEVFHELRRLAKMETPQLYIEDLRYEIGSIELSGPASTEVLHSVLTPYPAKDQPKLKHAEMFQSLLGLSNPAALPRGAVLGFNAQDPRLRYPPRKMQLPQDEDADMRLLELTAEWPAEERLAPYAIFDRESRHRSLALPSQKFINRRRSKIAPGAFLKPSSYDPQIPVLLVAAHPAAGTQAQGSWTLLAPWKCILPLWYSVVHCPLLSGGNPRFAGMNEIRQVNFERGLPTFPADYVGTNAGADWELEKRRERRRDWERRPKSKRTEWGSVGLGAGRKGEVGDGLACDFEYLFDLPREEQDGKEEESAAGSANTGESEADDSGDDDDENAMDVDEAPKQSKKKAKKPSLYLLNPVPKQTFDQHVLAESPPEMPPCSVINVRITLLARGVAGPCARIYRLPSPPPPSANVEVPATLGSQDPASSLPRNLRDQWLARIPPPGSNARRNNESSHPAGGGGGSTVNRLCASSPESRRKRLLGQELLAAPPRAAGTAAVDADGHHPVVPGAGDLVGFVTAGEFSLSEGRAAAVGSLAATKVLPGVRADGRLGRLCVVRNAGESVGWIARWEVIQ